MYQNSVYRFFWLRIPMHRVKQVRKIEHIATGDIASAWNFGQQLGASGMTVSCKKNSKART
jgi:hypothetical protein